MTNSERAKKAWTDGKIKTEYAEWREDNNFGPGAAVILTVSKQTLAKYDFGPYDSDSFFKIVTGFAPSPILKSSKFFIAPVAEYFEELAKSKKIAEKKILKRRAEKEAAEKKYGKAEENSDIY